MFAPFPDGVTGERRHDPVASVAVWCHELKLPSLVWLDSAVVGPDACSLVAACPDDLQKGNVADWPVFTGALARFQREHPGGAVVGYIEYDGSFLFGFYPQPLIYRHADGRWAFPAGEPAWHREASSGTIAIPTWRTPLEFIFGTPRAEFYRWVEQAQEHIAAGNIYQVNLAHQARAEWPLNASPFALYLRLRAISPAPQAAYLALHPDRTILCSSPEEFLRMQGRRIQTRPIKGTRPRGNSEAADRQSAAELLASEKERAELLMITDLLRNDLGRCCEYGSVATSDLFQIEPFAQVFHLVSTVEGRLRPGITHAQAVQMCSPGGSITGAPKKRAREIIASLEAGTRGPYTGSIGAFLPGEDSQFNIAIRTIIVEDGHAHFHVGAGIVADSDPALEWEETLHKGAGILRAAGFPD